MKIAATSTWIFACGPTEGVGGFSDDEFQPGTIREAVVCQGESRQQLLFPPPQNLPYPAGSLGWLSTGCGATLISPTKIVTAQHCLSATPGELTFYLHQSVRVEGPGGTVGFYDASANGVRWVAGRDPGDHELWADWAIVTLNTNLSAQPDYQTMFIVLPVSGTTVWDYGYPGDFPQKAMYDNSGTLTVGSDGTLYSTLDITQGNSGGPWYHINGSNGNAELVGVTANQGGPTPCAGTSGNHGGSARFFAYAPDNAGGVATANTSNGRLTVYASDKDWPFLGYRSAVTTAAGAGFEPWKSFDNTFPSGGKMSAVNLQDNRQQVWAIDTSSQLKTRWLNSNGTWSSWVVHPGTTTVKDVAATGANGVKTHLFILGTDNVVRVSWKTGDASSAWSAWLPIGTTITGATTLGATYIPSASAHQVFVGNTATGSWTAWGNGAPFNAFQPFGLNPPVKAIGAGLLGDGRAIVIAWQSGLLMQRVRAADGSSWSPWGVMSQDRPEAAYVTGLSVLKIAQQAGKARVFGVASDGEIFTLLEGAANVFSSTWARFYK